MTWFANIGCRNNGVNGYVHISFVFPKTHAKDSISPHFKSTYKLLVQTTTNWIRDWAVKPSLILYSASNTPTIICPRRRRRRKDCFQLAWAQGSLKSILARNEIHHSKCVSCNRMARSMASYQATSRHKYSPIN